MNNNARHPGIHLFDVTGRTSIITSAARSDAFSEYATSFGRYSKHT